MLMVCLAGGFIFEKAKSGMPFRRSHFSNDEKVTKSRVATTQPFGCLRHFENDGASGAACHGWLFARPTCTITLKTD